MKIRKPISQESLYTQIISTQMSRSTILTPINHNHCTNQERGNHWPYLRHHKQRMIFFFKCDGRSKRCRLHDSTTNHHFFRQILVVHGRWCGWRAAKLKLSWESICEIVVGTEKEPNQWRCGDVMISILRGFLI